MVESGCDLVPCPGRECLYSFEFPTQNMPRPPWALSPWGCLCLWTLRSWVSAHNPLLPVTVLRGGPSWPGWGAQWEGQSRDLCVLSPPPPAPFSGVKQEQLSPRGQAGPPESLGVPTAQETSVLRGKARPTPFTS